MPNKWRAINLWVDKIDFTVDDGKGWLTLSREKNEGMHRRRKVEKSCVTPAGTSTTYIFILYIHIMSRISGMKTHTHTSNTPEVIDVCPFKLTRLGKQLPDQTTFSSISERVTAKHNSITIDSIT